jgi:hypothetical protein
MPPTHDETIGQLTNGNPAQSTDIIPIGRLDSNGVNVTITAGSIAALSTATPPGGATGDIQYNANGVLGGSSATIDAAGNIISLTGSFTIGDWSTLPPYVQPGPNYVSFGAFNYMSGQIPTGGFSVSPDAGAVCNISTYCTDPNTFAIGIACSVLGPYVASHIFISTVSSGVSNGEAFGLYGIARVQDSTVTNATLIAADFFIDNIPVGATVSNSYGCLIANTSGAGTARSYGLQIFGVEADPTNGTAIGLSIAYINGHTTYAIKSDTPAPSVFAGSLSATTLIEANTLTPSSGATAGVTGQIAWDSGFVYICTAGGIAGSATWKKAALTTA